MMILTIITIISIVLIVSGIVVLVNTESQGKKLYIVLNMITGTFCMLLGFIGLLFVVLAMAWI